MPRAGCERLRRHRVCLKDEPNAEWSALGQVHILLPPLQKLRTIVERLRPLSDVIAVRCNNNGKLQISVQTESVSVDTRWSGCTNPKMGASSASLLLPPPPSRFSLCLPAQEGASQNPDVDSDVEKPDPDHLFGVLISIKSFIKFLNSHVLSSTTIACGSLRAVVDFHLLMFSPW